MIFINSKINSLIEYALANREKYINANPYPHIIIDNFFHDAIESIVNTPLVVIIPFVILDFYNSVATTGTLTMTAATASSNGYLSSSDFTPLSLSNSVSLFNISGVAFVIVALLPIPPTALLKPEAKSLKLPLDNPT